MMNKANRTDQTIVFMSNAVVVIHKLFKCETISSTHGMKCYQRLLRMDKRLRQTVSCSNVFLLPINNLQFFFPTLKQN